MLQAFHLSYSPDPRVGDLFKDLNLSLDLGERAVLVGRNGTGKTKLVEILAGLIAPDSGKVLRDSYDRVAYLPQDVDLDFQGSLAEFLLPSDDLEDGARQAQLVRLCARMRIAKSQLDQDYASLSIGERMRAAIARLLIDDPTVLLLDEPTNNLDVAGREWLVQFLLGTHAAVLMVCHDRSVVDAVADRVLELTPSGLRQFTGGYSDMLALKEIERENQAALHERQVKEEKRLKAIVTSVQAKAKQVVRRPTGRTYDPKAKAFYRGMQAKLDRRAQAIQTRVHQVADDRVDKPFEEIVASITFRSKPLRYSDALVVRDLRKSYGERVLFEHLNLTVESGERVAIVGPNGAGKTTLFRMLLGEESPDAGEIRWSPDAEPLYLSQSRSRLDLDQTVLNALDLQSRSDEEFARQLLGCLRISGDAVRKPVRVLSVGERTKVELASMLLTTANILLLDEPTNHLDIVSLEALEGALADFPGSIVFTSHDQAFIERVGSRRVEVGMRG